MLFPHSVFNCSRALLAARAEAQSRLALPIVSKLTNREARKNYLTEMRLSAKT
jgi:hypothetical protein